MTTHVFDEAIALTRTGDHQWSGQTHPAYANMVGPFGGITTAQVVNAMMQHPQRLGDPIALTVNFCAAVADGAFTITAIPVRTNRSTQHWTAAIVQNDAQGQPVVATTATVITAVRRETWSLSDLPMPAVPRPAEVQPRRYDGAMAWLDHYELRPVSGMIPQDWDGRQHDGSTTQLWMRDQPPRPLDFCALLALSDIFYPRVWLRRATRVPAGTVSITTYFHAGEKELRETGSGYLLGQARGQEFRNGFFDQSAQLWNEAGILLCTSHQIVYFKE